MRMKFRFYYIFIVALLVCFSSENHTLSKEPNLDEIIKKVQAHQTKIADEIKDATFIAKLLYKERNKDKKIEREVIAERRVYMKGDSKRHEEYLYMIINGKKLDDREMEKELKDWRKNGKKQEETKMPLTPEGEGAYNFYLVGSERLDDVDTWIIGFEAKQKKEGYVNGKGYISKSNFNIMRAEFTPAKLPRVIKDMSMALSYSEVKGYWMPVKFEMDMKVKVSLVLDLYYKHITIEDVYSQYSFNNRLGDSIFESE